MVWRGANKQVITLFIHSAIFITFLFLESCEMLIPMLDANLHVKCVD